MSLADFEILKSLGAGAYSTVFKARRRSDGNIYALKKVPMAKLKQKEKLNALNEVRILASIKHPNVISYKEAFFDEPSSSLCIVSRRRRCDHFDCSDLISWQHPQGFSSIGCKHP